MKGSSRLILLHDQLLLFKGLLPFKVGRSSNMGLPLSFLLGCLIHLELPRATHFKCHFSRCLWHSASALCTHTDPYTSPSFSLPYTINLILKKKSCLIVRSCVSYLANSHDRSYTVQVQIAHYRYSSAWPLRSTGGGFVWVPPMLKEAGAVGNQAEGFLHGSALGQGGATWP